MDIMHMHMQPNTDPENPLEHARLIARVNVIIVCCINPAPGQESKAAVRDEMKWGGACHASHMPNHMILTLFFAQALARLLSPSSKNPR